MLVFCMQLMVLLKPYEESQSSFIIIQLINIQIICNYQNKLENSLDFLYTIFIIIYLPILIKIKFEINLFIMIFIIISFIFPDYFHFQI